MLIKIAKILLILIFAIIILVLVALMIWTKIYETSPEQIPLLYWLIFINWTGIVAIFRLNGEASLKTGFLFFVLGSFIAVIGLPSYAEIFMKVGFITLLTGLTQALVEYKKYEN